MSAKSFEERSELRRTANAARRLRVAADRTAAQIGTLTTKPRTPARYREFNRLSVLLDDLDAGTVLEEKIAGTVMTPTQESALRAAARVGSLAVHEVLSRENGDIAVIDKGWTMLVTPDGIVTLWPHMKPILLSHPDAS
ncbi:hypothetical protein [Paeniglutamicibacter terrestris]|uniref:Uncharacterized protein n=1 Tax=Paeniglutamicibacter terrestris TaxID=2723403 RepID=A0ABX1G4B4_9MICC|nr:hypothetical protein [Paeniglutamicibacter terrestris]NKG21082.1 hypothetical protein [Paeniglutamicibacter terrestris]